MNFQSIAPIEPSKQLLDLAFRKAREQGQQKNLKGNWLQIIRSKEALKLDVIKDAVVTRLEKMLRSLPETLKLPEFYVSLMKLTLDFAQYKKSCGSMLWAIQQIRGFHKDYVRRIVKTKDRETIKDLSRQFYGRISSVLKQIDSNLKFLEQTRQVMRTYPDVKDMFTICLYGFPNVGKTTLLNMLTGSKAETAAYAFTTKSINSGYFTLNDKRVQVLDVPGTLARAEKMNNIELQAELAMKELAKVIIYVFDISEECGYSLKKQLQLYKKLKLITTKKVLAYLSKKDLIASEVIAEFQANSKIKHYSLEEIKEKVSGMVE